MCVHDQLCTQIYMLEYLHMYTSSHLQAFVYLGMDMCEHTYTDMYVYMHVCMHMCVCVCVCVYSCGYV